MVDVYHHPKMTQAGVADAGFVLMARGGWAMATLLPGENPLRAGALFS